MSRRTFFFLAAFLLLCPALAFAGGVRGHYIGTFGFGSAAGGGGGGGSVFIGDNTTGGTSLGTAVNELWFVSTGFTSVGTGNVCNGYVRIAGAWGATGFKIVIFNSSDAVITNGTSQAGTPVENNWGSASFSPCASVTDATTYKLGVIFTGGGPDLRATPGGSSWLVYKDTTGTYASPPTTLHQSANESHDSISVYVTN